MKLLLQKIGLLLLILAIIKALASSIVPRTFKDNLIDAKWETFKNKEEINLIILGTSRMQWGFDPAVIDSLSNGELRAFNMGAPEFTVPYSTDMLLDKLSSLDHKIKYVVVELTLPNLEPTDPLRGIEFYLMNNSDGIPNVSEHLFWNFFNKVHQFVGLQTEVMSVTKQVATTNTGLPINHLTFDKNGYTRIEESTVKEYSQIASLIDATKDGYRKAHIANDQGITATTYYQEIIDSFKREQIEVLFVLSPFITNESKPFVLNIFRNLSYENKILIDTATHFDLIEETSYYQDAAHFNHSGALIYSKILGEALIVFSSEQQIRLQRR